MTEADVETTATGAGQRMARSSRFARWRRRLVRAALAFAVLLLIARAAHPLWLPRVVDGALASRGYSLVYDDLDLSVLGGRLELQHVVIAPRVEGEDPDAAAPEPLARLEYLGVDLDVSALLTGTLRVHRVDVEGLRARIERDAAGAWNFERLLAAAAGDGDAAPAESPEPEAAAGAPAEPAPLDFRSPVAVGSFGVRDVRVRFVDALAEPPIDTELSLDVGLDDLGHEERPLRFTLVASAEGLLDVLRVEASAALRERELSATVALQGSGLGVGRLATYMAPLGIRPHAGRLDLGLAADVELARAEEDVHAAGSLVLRGLALRADLDEAVAVDEVRVAVTALERSALDVAEVVVSGVRGRAQRLADGTLRAAGLDLVGAPGAAQPDAAPADSGPSRPNDGEDAGDAGTFAASVDRVAVEGVTLRFDDAAVAPPAALVVQLGLELGALRLGGAATPAPTSLEATVEIVDAGRLTVAGEASLGGPRRAVLLDLRGEDWTGAALAPYLAAAGVRPELEAGAFQAQVEGSLEATDGGGSVLALEVRDVRLVDGDRAHAAVGRVAIEGLALAPDGRVEVGRLELAGLRLPVSLAPEGSLHALGVSTAPGTLATRADVVDTRRLELRDARLTLEGLVLGGADPASPTRREARVALQGRLTDVAEELELAGTIGSLPGALDLELDLRLAATGLQGAGLEPWLAGLGLEPRIVDGAFGLSVEAHVRARGEGLLADAAVRDLALREGEHEWLGLDALELVGLVSEPGGLSVRSIALRAPRLALSRGPDGALELLGLRLVPAAPPAGGAPDAPLGAPVGAPVGAPGDAPEAAAAPTTLAIGEVSVDGARVTWRDAAIQPEVATQLDLEARLTGLSTAPGAAPLEFALRSSVAGVLEALDLTGTARLDPRATQLVAELELGGLRSGPLATYLPPGAQVSLVDGRFRARLEARRDAHAKGGQRLSLSLADLDYREAGAEEALLALRSLEFEAPRIDAAARVFDVERLVVAGLAADVRRTTPTELELLGLTLASAPADDAPTTPAASDAPGADVATVDDARALDTGSPAAPVGVLPPPTIRLGTLDVGIERLRYRDDTRPGTEPLVARLALVTPGEQVLCLPEPEGLPPFECALVGAVAPFVEEVALRARVAPFLDLPRLELDLAVLGLRGERLASVLPDLAARLDASAYEDGSLRARVEADVEVRRRGPADFDLARGFGARLAVTDFALRTTPEADPLAGFERLAVDLRRARPDTGDVHVASVELDGSRARVTREPAGLRVAGLLFPTPPPAEEAGAEAAPAAAPAASSQEAASPAPPERGGELRVDRLVVSGLDFEYRDTTADPPLRLPIADLELEVRGFSTRALVEPVPVSFRAVVDAGTVTLPERSAADNLLSGVLGSVSSALGGGGDYELEERRVWDLLEVTGRLTLAPEPRGRVQLDLLGLELPAFRSAAAAAGVSVGDGLVDSRVSLRFRNDGALSIDSRTTSTYLSLSEPADGPISKYLGLPAPLDTVLFLLRNGAGQQVVPLRVDVGADGLGLGAVLGAAGEALGTLVVDALASAPARLLGPLTDLVELAGLAPEPLSSETRALEFAAGSGVAAAGLEELGELARGLAADPGSRVIVQHQLGRGDVDLVTRLANPSPADGGALVTRLRDRLDAVEVERAELAALTHAQLAVGAADAAARGTERLQALDRERAEVEAGLDRVFELLRPGAERRREQRTRAAALALAEQRLERVRAALLRIGGAALAERVDVRRPRWDVDEQAAGGRVTLTPRSVAGSR